MHRSDNSQTNSLVEQYLYDDSYLAVSMPQDVQSLAREIRFNADYFAANKLLQSSKWAHELLVTISGQQGRVEINPFQPTSASCERGDHLNDNDLRASKHASFNKVFYEEPCGALDVLNLARTLFDLREYRKCSHVLQPFTNSTYLAKNAMSQSCLFLKNYALFLISEQQKEEEILETCGTSDKVNCSKVLNKELVAIEVEMEEHFRADRLNGLNCYLMGVIFKERNKLQEAKEAFIKALLQQPLLWSAWLELGQMLKQGDRGIIDQLCNHWMRNFYLSSFYLEIH